MRLVYYSEKMGSEIPKPTASPTGHRPSHFKEQHILNFSCPQSLIIGIVFPDIRNERASLPIKALKELARYEKEILRDEAGVGDDDDVLLRHAQTVNV